MRRVIGVGLAPVVAPVVLASGAAGQAASGAVAVDAPVPQTRARRRVAVAPLDAECFAMGATRAGAVRG